MTVVRSTLSDSARETAGEALQSTLVDLIGLSLIGKQAHWNIVGPRFRSIHLQLDEVVSTARSFSDTVAERAAALGVAPDGRPETIAAAYTLPGSKSGWIRDDPVTQDLLIGITAELEKQRWMFEAENWPRD
jgi:starvation-inducible DNA-binding protein